MGNFLWRLFILAHVLSKGTTPLPSPITRSFPLSSSSSVAAAAAVAPIPGAPTPTRQFLSAASSSPRFGGSVGSSPQPQQPLSSSPRPTASALPPVNFFASREIQLRPEIATKTSLRDSDFKSSETKKLLSLLDLNAYASPSDGGYNGGGHGGYNGGGSGSGDGSIRGADGLTSYDYKDVRIIEDDEYENDKDDEGKNSDGKMKRRREKRAAATRQNRPPNLNGLPALIGGPAAYGGGGGGRGGAPDLSPGLEHSGTMPRFGETPQVVQSSPGSTAYLRCTVYDLGPYTVSWVRGSDMHILTVGEFTFASDERYRALHQDNKNDWNLQISNVQPEDEGVYECQVSTDPKISRDVNLNVADATTTIIPPARVEITGGGIVERGGHINLTCNATGEPFPPAYIEWYKNGNKVESDALRGIVITNVIRFTTVSVLTIERANMHDAGEYICRTSTHEFANKRIHVLNEIPALVAALFHLTSPPFLIATLHA